MPVIDREDRFLEAGDALSVAMQRLRAADLTQVLDAGAKQVQGSVADLAGDSSFAGKQVETVRSIRDGIKGLIESTAIITDRLRARPIPARQAITSPDYIEGVIKHAYRFVPVAAAAIGIDLFAIWAFFLMMTLRAGRQPNAAATPNGAGKSDQSAIVEQVEEQ